MKKTARARPPLATGRQISHHFILCSFLYFANSSPQIQKPNISQPDGQLTCLFLSCSTVASATCMLLVMGVVLAQLKAQWNTSVAHSNDVFFMLSSPCMPVGMMFFFYHSTVAIVTTFLQRFNNLLQENCSP